MDHSDDSALPGRLVLLTTTHRIAPGLLSWPAWELLRAADLVVCPDPGNPQLPYLREAGVAVEPSAPTGRELVDLTGGGRTVVYLAGGEGDRAVTDELSRLGGSGRVHMPDLELLPGSYDLPGARLLDLVQVMDRIRRECPWSSVRTTEELVKYGIEEVYELAEAAEEGDREALREELGDVLLQVVFHARIAQDDPEEPFSIDDVAATIVDKLIHRHPHVFGDAVAETAEDVREHWLRTKAEEKRRGSITEGIPLGQPALALAAKLGSRARQAGLSVAVPDQDAADTGDRLLALALAAQAAGIDPESALRAAARRYRDAILEAEKTG
ncbi:nucleoside triphosphate pyrophosphohydrolase [Actinacidiphila glaucinigra]|uniref:nucleoside triphosphate pyrophosphohydrolase n=1 Tax=Actinacidiphila glaucinigra TaxID=235986 RepID=UPI002DD9A62D|nr:nucleoside triphosphate pyrophosphohydrolase [Actinacidiphila glaucinigra]WSD61745.1 nucleoside triphosphate pyrophosphohydrolase [Actinacidiphila glaucinigra]